MCVVETYPSCKELQVRLLKPPGIVRFRSSRNERSSSSLSIPRGQNTHGVPVAPIVGGSVWAGGSVGMGGSVGAGPELFGQQSLSMG